MISHTLSFAAIVLALACQVAAHTCPWNPGFYGFNTTGNPTPDPVPENNCRPWDNRPLAPLYNRPYDQWFGHGPAILNDTPSEFLELEVGKDFVLEITCDKMVTTYGPYERKKSDPEYDYACPGQPSIQFHTDNVNTTGGCGLSVIYTSDLEEAKSKPFNFVIFSVQTTCVYHRFNTFAIPKDMPPCPPGGCHCGYHHVHKWNGGDEMYMNLAKCKFINATSTKQLGTPQVATVCGADPPESTVSDPSKCTKGAKQPFYWLQAEKNNYFEPRRPGYRPEFGFANGAQNDIFRDENDPPGPPAYTPTVTSTPNWYPPRPTLTTCPHTTSTRSMSTQSTTSTPSMPELHTTGTQSTTSSVSHTTSTQSTSTQSTTSTPSMPPAHGTSTPSTSTTSTATHGHRHHHHHHRPWDRRRMTAERDV